MRIVEKGEMFLYFANRGKTGNTVLLLIKRPGLFGGIPVYAHKDIVKGLEIGEVGIFPCQYQLKDWVNKDGTVKTTEAGEPLTVLG